MNLTLAGGQVVGVGGVHRADVAIHGSVITAVGPAPDPSGPVLDARGLLVAPGFIDLQLNGAFGFDLTSDPAAVWDVASVLPRYGVSSFLPTVISAPLATYDQALAVLQAGPPPGWIGAVPLGWHVEGPMLNPPARGPIRAVTCGHPIPGSTAGGRGRGGSCS
jgi:N-acetylglucosamine-6-phosphate deacetylase